MSLANNILKFLYNNDTGNYINIYEEFLSEDIEKKNIDVICKDLAQYIEKESIYEQRGMIDLDSNSEEINTATELRIRINQKGRERYESIKNKNLDRKLTIKLTIIPLVISTVISLFFSFILPSLNNIIKDKKEIIPPIMIEIENNTSEDIKVWHYQDFYLWTPGKLNSGYIEGVCELITDNNQDNITVASGEALRLSVVIVNNDKYYNYYKSGDYTISVALDINDKYYPSKYVIPFNEDGLNDYYDKIVLEEDE